MRDDNFGIFVMDADGSDLICLTDDSAEELLTQAGLPHPKSVTEGSEVRSCLRRRLCEPHPLLIAAARQLTDPEG